MNKINEDNRDVFLIRDNYRYRVRACGIIIKDNKVLMVKNNKEDYYYSLGGAVNFGETTVEACIREVYEETGFHYDIDRLLFIHENFFQVNEVKWQEIAFYYLMKESDNMIFKKSISSTGAIEEKVWINIDNYQTYKAYPKFFKDELKNLPLSVKYIIERD